MISTPLYFLPLLSALAGWLISLLGIHLFFKRLEIHKNAQALVIAKYISAGFSLDEMAGKLSSEESVEKILPFAEGHIDHFLRVKLPAAMPMLSMFISDKLVADMKAIFMTELKELFPALISQYIANAKESFNIEQLLAGKLTAIDLHHIRAALRKQLAGIALFGAVIGLITGFIQIFLTLLA